jgi:hypothetical protein
MSTHVTVAIAKPNHLPVMVHMENKLGAQWVPDGSSVMVSVGGAEAFLVHGSRRLVIEELPEGS